MNFKGVTRFAAFSGTPFARRGAAAEKLPTAPLTAAVAFAGAGKIRSVAVQLPGVELIGELVLYQARPGKNGC